MREVYILGAGFSRAISDKMPLTDDLAGNDAIRSFIGRTLVKSTNVESVLTLLSESQPWLSEDENLRNRADFIQFSQTVNTTIRDHQVAAIRQSGFQPPSWLSKLSTLWLRDNPTIITFNYDTLVEKTITHTCRSIYKDTDPANLPWAHSHLYEVPIPRITSRGGLVEHSSLNDSLQTFPRLIKLHGSLNWYYSGSHTAAGEEIYDIGISPFWASSNKDRKHAEMVRFSAGKIPLIIPPTSGKSPFFTNETVRAQWRSARKALTQGDRIIVIGYSLPQADHMVRYLLEYACAQYNGNEVIKEVVVVNPDHTTLSTYQDLLLKCNVKYYESINDFMATF